MCLKLDIISTDQGDIAELIAPHFLLSLANKVLKLVELQLRLCDNFAFFLMHVNVVEHI